MRILSVLFLSIVSLHAATVTLVPGSIGIATGTGLSPATAVSAIPDQLDTSLGGVSVQVVDSSGVARIAGLYAVSPASIMYAVPKETAPGMATVNILNGETTVLSTQVQVQALTPTLFSANGDGKGVAAATAVRTVIPTRISSPVTVFQCGDQAGSCVGVPMDPGLDAPVTLSFYGTGIRGAKTLTITIGGEDVPVTFAGPQATVPGVDQIDVPLTLALRGKGLVDVVVTADGVASNAVQVNIQ
jgi:uncharacterized protein (TIGR03437 family)